MKQKKPTIISISAVPGGGKTAVTRALNNVLPNSKMLCFDDYECNIEDISDWFKRGSDLKEWNVDKLVKDINSIVNSKKIIDYLILDFRFGNEHPEIKKYIDYAVFIDTPLDIALGRRFLRDYLDISIPSKNWKNPLLWRRNLMDIFFHSRTRATREELKFYLSYTRLTPLEILKRVKPKCDLIIDGSQTLDAIVNQISQKIESIFNNNS